STSASGAGASRASRPLLRSLIPAWCNLPVWMMTRGAESLLFCGSASRMPPSLLTTIGAGRNASFYFESLHFVGIEHRRRANQKTRAFIGFLAASRSRWRALSISSTREVSTGKQVAVGLVRGRNQVVQPVDLFGSADEICRDVWLIPSWSHQAPRARR